MENTQISKSDSINQVVTQLVITNKKNATGYLSDNHFNLIDSGMI